MRFAPEWGADPLDPKKFQRNSVEIPRYATIERNFSGQAQTVVSQFQAGQITRPEAMKLFKESLQDAESSAFVAGRRARGAASLEITDAEAKMLTGRHSRNMRYFSGFLDDIENGEGRMPYNKRADLYAKSLWSLYTRGETTDWAEPENIGGRYFWVMDPDAEHCVDCLERAGKSRDQNGFTWDELIEIGFPGENTKCRVNCRCHIRPEQRQKAPPFQDVPPAENPTEGLEQFIDMMGGPGLKIRMPAAGIPSVGLTPEVLVDLFQRFPSVAEADEAARLMPVVPAVISKPETVIPNGDDLRYFIGQGLTIKVERNDLGLWLMTGMYLGTPINIFGGLLRNPHTGGAVSLSEFMRLGRDLCCL
jgi:hypothetical protein